MFLPLRWPTRGAGLNSWPSILRMLFRRERPPALIEISAASSREISRNDRSPPLGRLLAVRSPPAWPVLNTPRGSISSQAD
jgi:hypothetical protein